MASDLFCTGNIGKEPDSFEVLSIKDYCGRREMLRPLSDTLIPIIKKEEFDTLSEDFLREYYPEWIRFQMKPVINSLIKSILDLKKDLLENTLESIF